MALDSNKIGRRAPYIHVNVVYIVPFLSYNAGYFNDQLIKGVRILHIIDYWPNRCGTIDGGDVLVGIRVQ